ncbi:hypothetical protein ES708_20502 [subsurface metagenome]
MIKISIHRKYTKDFQSYGYRIGLEMDVNKVDDARSGYYEGKAFLNERIAEEDLIIKNIMDKRVAEKGLGYKELVAIPERKVGKNGLGGVAGELEKREFKGDGDGNVLLSYDVKQIKRTSDKAVLVELFGEKGDLWIPKSCIGDGDAMDLMQTGVKTMLFVKNWFLQKNGLI